MKNLSFPCSVMLVVLASLSACKPEPVGGELEGSYWILSTATFGKQVVRFSKSNETSLVFSHGRLTGKAPCNSYFASYSSKAATLVMSEVGATERFCDEMEQENAYLSLLSKAQTFNMKGDKLEIFSVNGYLTYFRMKNDKVEASKFAQGVGKLVKLFAVLERDNLLHLHPILRVDNPGNYPYQGIPIDTSFYKYFSNNIREIWMGSGGDVLAVGQYAGYFICRIPGRYVSSDIAIFRVEDNLMQHVETIAWAWCDEGWCNQQDAWLTDIDLDGRTDVVQHYTLTDDQGKIKEERLTLHRQDEHGDLLPDKETKLDKVKFRMAKI